MESLLALQELIKEAEAKISLQNKQIQRHNSGEEKLSPVVLASTENALEQASEKLTRYKEILQSLEGEDGEKLDEKYRLEIAAERKRYFDKQDSRLQTNIEHPTDVKLAALRVLGELPPEVQLQDEEILDIATKSVELTLPELSELTEILDTITNEFHSMLEKSDDKSIKRMAVLNCLIPVMVLHMKILKENIMQNVAEENEKNQALFDAGKIEAFKPKKFDRFPRYHDWWIREMWVSHPAYFALFKWKAIVNAQCQTLEQKKAWTIIFDRWMLIKKLLNDKGSLAYEYSYIFDSLLEKYIGFEEEMQIEKLDGAKAAFLKALKEENFEKNADFHSIITPYFQYKAQKKGLSF